MFLLEYSINYFVFNVFYFFRRRGNGRVESLNNAFSFLMLYASLFFLVFLNILTKIPGMRALIALVIFFLIVSMCGIIFKIFVVNKKFLMDYKKKIHRFTFLEEQKHTNFFVLSIGGIVLLMLAILI